MSDKPQADHLQKYPEEFLNDLKSKAEDFKKRGATSQQLNRFFYDSFNNYNKSKAPVDNDFKNQPKWFRESELDYKNTMHKRGKIRQMGEALKMGVRPTGVGTIGFTFSNPLKGLRQETDVISPNMVDDVDKLTSELMYEPDDINVPYKRPTGTRDVSKNVEEHVRKSKELLTQKYNKGGGGQMGMNIDLLLDESFSEIIQQELEASIETSAKTNGAHKRDYILSDPEKIKKLKKQFVGMGFRGTMVDRAFEKALVENKRAYILDHHERDVIKSLGEEEFMRRKDDINAYYTETADNLAIELFNPKEYERMQKNVQLNDLLEQQKNVHYFEHPDKIRKLEEDIDKLDKELGYKESIPEEKGKPYKSKFLAGIGMAMGAPTSKTDRWKSSNVINRLYDKEMRKIPQGDETEEQLERQRRVTAVIKKNDSIKDLPNSLRNEMVNSRKILLDIESAENHILENKIQNKDWTSVASDEERMSAIRQLKSVRFEKDQELIRFEAYSRMYLLNQNVAVMDKNAKRYMMDAGLVFRDINARPFLKNPNPSDEQVREVIRPIYEEMGIPLDSKEYEMTEPDIVKEVMRSTAHLSDLSIKMLGMGMMGGNAATAFFNGMSKTGTIGKVAGNFFNMMFEEAKFRIIGGHEGTGASFYIANKAFPHIRTGNKHIDTIWNGFVQGTVGMTAAMEGSAQMIAAWDAMANDKDIARSMSEAFGPVDERRRRLLVELISAAPFGIKAVVERGMLPSASSENLTAAAKYFEKKGQPELAEQMYELASHSVMLGDSKMYREARDLHYKSEKLKEFGRRDAEMTNEQINKEYEKLVKEEGLTDPFKNKKVAVHVDDNFYHPKIQHETLELAAKIEVARLEGLDPMKMSENKLNETFRDAVERSNAIKHEYTDRTEVTEFDGDAPAPTRRKKYKLRVSEFRIKESRQEVKDIKKDLNFTKNLQAPAKKIAKTISGLKKKVGKEDFDLIVDKFSGLKNGSREFDAMVNMLFQAKNKNEALELIDHLGDIIHKVEVQTRPEAERYEYTTRRPNQNDPKVSVLTNFRDNMASYKRGIKDGRTDVVSDLHKLHEIVKDRVAVLPKSAAASKSELAAIADAFKLPKNYKPEQLIKKMEKAEKILDKLEKREAVRGIREVFKLTKKQTVNNKDQQLKLDFLSWNRLSIADMLFNNKTGAAEVEIAKLRTLQKELKEGDSRLQMIEGQINALNHTGSRDMAMIRQAELEVEAQVRKLTIPEKIEYEFLSMTDGSSMTRADLARAKDIVSEIERTGRHLAQREAQYDAIVKELNWERAVEELNLGDVNMMELLDAEISPEAKGGLSALRALAKFRKKYLYAHEGFTSMMERLSADAPNRKLWEGHFHTFAEDMYRAREGSVAEFNKTLNRAREVAVEAYGSSGKKLDKQLKDNKTKGHKFSFWHSGKFKSFGNGSSKRKDVQQGITVDQAVNWFEWLHDRGTWKLFQNEGWGMKKKSYEDGFKFGEVEAKEMMDAIREFVVETTGNDGAIKMAEWRLTKGYPELYAGVDQVYLKKHGVDLGFRVNYSPVVFEKMIKLDAEGRPTEEFIDYADLMDAPVSHRVMSVSPSMVKRSTRSGSIVLNKKIGAEEKFQNYLRDAMHYKYFQEPIDRAREMFNSQRMREALKAKYKTDDVYQMIKKNISDIAKDQPEGPRIKELNKIKNKFVVGVLGANPLLFMKQMTSMSAYRVGIGSAKEDARFSQYMARTFVDGYETMGKIWNSQFEQNRIAGPTFNRDLAETKVQMDKLYKTGGMAPKTATEAVLFPTKLGDSGAILIAGSAFYRTKLDTYREMGMSPGKAEKRAYEDFVKYTKLTQQSPYMEDLSHIQRWGTLGKYATLFQNTPQQYYRISLASRRNAIAAVKASKNPEERANAIQNLNRSMRDGIVYQFVLPAMFRAAAMGFYLGGDDKGKDRFVDDPGQLIAMAMGSGAYPLLLGSAGQQVLNKMITGHAFDVDVGGVLQDIITGGQEALDVILTAKEYEDYQMEFKRILDGTAPIGWGDVMKVIGFGSQAFGVPGISLSNTAKGVYDYINNKTDNPAALIGLSESAQGKYNRSPQYPAMKPFLDMGFKKGWLAFEKYLRSTTDYNYYKNNSARLIREFRMYSHFGGHNNEINFLYSAARNESQKARYLNALKSGKKVAKPLLIGEVVDYIFEDPMSPGEFNRYLLELLEYGVIDGRTIMAMAEQDKDFNRMATKILRKSAK